MFDLKEPKRLGDGCDCPHCKWLSKACDRVEALERENAAMRAELEGIATCGCMNSQPCDCYHAGLARSCLAALAPATSKEPT